MSVNRINKTAMVLSHLKEHGSITSLDAINKWTATRLSAIIFKLRQKHIIDTEMVSPYGSTRHGVYHYRGEINGE